jgi:hypothetical protein
MRALIVLAVLLFLGLSLFADYKWKRWMAARKRERDGTDHLYR